MLADWCTGGDPNNSTKVQVWVFDIEKDPTESTDIASKHKAIVKQLKARLAEQVAATDQAATLTAARHQC